MLDRSLPFAHVIMRRPSTRTEELPRLPPGYRFAGLETCGADAWSAIETAVGEFDSEELAGAYFREHYLARPADAATRCLYAVDGNGRPVGTVTAWWTHTRTRRDRSLHWLAVLPDAQRRGIGTALVLACLRRLHELDGDGPVYLHTQTWSHVAIRIYQRAGFAIVPDRFGTYPNDYAQALAILTAARRG